MITLHRLGVRDAEQKTKDLDEEVLKKNLNPPSRFWGCDEKFRLMFRKDLYPYEYMDGWEKFE